MQLTEAQKKYLRGMAHHIKPVVSIGKLGLTDAVSAELDATLERHELVKINIRVSDRDVRDTIIQELAQQCSANLVSRVGNMAVLYRKRKKKPGITLP